MKNPKFLSKLPPDFLKYPSHCGALVVLNIAVEAPPGAAKFSKMSKNSGIGKRPAILLKTSR